MSTQTPNETTPLNLAERDYLESNQNLDLDKLCEALKRPRNFIEFELTVIRQQKFEQESAPAVSEKSKPEDGVTTVKKSPLLNAFVTRKEGGICAMSGAAAQLSDEVSKAAGKKTILDTRPDCVTRVRK